MPVTTTTTVAEVINEILGEARMWMADASLFYPKAGAAQQFIQFRDIRGQKGATATFPKWTAVAFGDGAQGETYATISTMDTSEATVTATRKHCRIQIADEAVYASAEDLIATAGRMFGLAAATKFDTDVCATFSSLGTATGANATNSPVTAAEYRAYITALQTVNAPGPYAAIWHPWGWNEFLAESSSPILNAAASDQVAKDVWGDKYITSIHGVANFFSTVLPTANAAADHLGAFISPYAIGCTWQKDLEVEVIRRPEAGVTELNGTFFAGVGVIDNTMGYQMLQDID